MIPAAFAVLDVEAAAHNLQHGSPFGTGCKNHGRHQGEWLRPWLAAHC